MSGLVDPTKYFQGSKEVLSLDSSWSGYGNFSFWFPSNWALIGLQSFMLRRLGCVFSATFWRFHVCLVWTRFQDSSGWGLDPSSWTTSLVLSWSWSFLACCLLQLRCHRCRLRLAFFLFAAVNKDGDPPLAGGIQSFTVLHLCFSLSVAQLVQLSSRGILVTSPSTYPLLNF